MKTLISMSANPSLPKGVVGISYWQSASANLDNGLAELCKKVGCVVTFIDIGSREYQGVIVSPHQPTKQAIAYIKKNWASLPKQEDR